MRIESQRKKEVLGLKLANLINHHNQGISVDTNTFIFRTQKIREEHKMEKRASFNIIKV